MFDAMHFYHGENKEKPTYGVSFRTTPGEVSGPQPYENEVNLCFHFDNAAAAHKLYRTLGGPLTSADPDDWTGEDRYTAMPNDGMLMLYVAGGG